MENTERKGKKMKKHDDYVSSFSVTVLSNLDLDHVGLYNVDPLCSPVNRGDF